MLRLNSKMYRERKEEVPMEKKKDLLTTNGVAITPSEYFEQVKEKKQTITDEKLKQMYESCLHLIEKYRETNQIKGLQKLVFHIETIEKEYQLLEAGIDTFVLYEDLTDYIENVADKVVKIIELRNYEREIPDEIVEVISKTKHLFNEMYVVFTDYTGEVECQIEKERRDKDPILFGTFQDIQTGTVIERFYFLGDWEDEYCDLTLDKMVAQIKKKSRKDVTHTVQTPIDTQALRDEIHFLATGKKPKAEEKGFIQMIKSKFSVKSRKRG